MLFAVKIIQNMKSFLVKNKIANIALLIALLSPLFYIYGAELNSASYKINNSIFGVGQQMDSTNFSITGGSSQDSNGSFSSGSLPLIPGEITSCGKITTAGTYTLSTNLIGISGPCFLVQANNVTIDGGGYTVLASTTNSSYAVLATSSVSDGGSAYGTTTIQNITFTGFQGGVNASGNNASSGNNNGGAGGSVIISTSTLGTVLTSGGLGFGSGSVGNGATVTINNSTTGNITSSGTGGSIIITGSDLDLSNKTYTAGSTFNFSYSGTINTTNTTLSALQHFIKSGTDYGSYVGGGFPLFPSIINTCGNLYFSGTYTFGGDITGNCSISNTGITILGAGHTLTGDLTIGGAYIATTSNITINGNVSISNSSGKLAIIDASNFTGLTTISGSISGDGSSSLGNTTVNAGGSVATSSVSFVADVINNGTINAGNSVLGKTTNNSIINTGVGTFYFNASSTNSGTVNGNAILSASSTNSGTITGDVTFGAYTSVDGSVSIGGATIFSGTGYINGSIYDSTGTTTIATWVFNDSSKNNGILKGDAVFYNTSQNAASGTVSGNATFRDTSKNLGIVTGNSNVYSPVVRPLTGTTNGLVTYYEYSGMYFNDIATGHGVSGKWNDINNWWSNASSTVQSPVLPTGGDSVIILSGNITSGGPATVKNATFQGTSTNGITLTVLSSSLDAALFNASSSNNGTINGNATFAGPDTTNNGTVTGYITRQYNAGIYNVITDFTANSVHWIVQSINGATVNLTGAIYSLAINTFQALNNGIFIWKDLVGGIGGVGTPELSIIGLSTGVNIKWKPIVAWGSATTCQYKMDSGSYTSVDCSKNGSDVPKPTAGAHIILFRSVSGDLISGKIAEKSIAFTYDNTQPVDTDCTSPLDEATRPYYYLTSNVGDCIITASTTLRGDDNGGGHFYSIGSLTGSSTNIVLQNVTATGTVSSFNNITVASSTLSGTISINGNFSSDNLSRFGNTTVGASGSVTGGTFVGNLVNNGTIINSTTTPVTVSGSTTNNGTTTGGFIMNNNSINNGIITGTTTLNGASINNNRINGNVTLNGTASNQGTVNGDLTFGMYTAVNNAVTLSGSTNFFGTNIVTGNIKDNRDALITAWLFKDSSRNTGLTIGDAFFNGSSTNAGTVSGNAHFSDGSTNSGTVTGNADIYHGVPVPLSGTVNGIKTYHSYANAPSFRNISGDNNWNNTSNWFAFATSSIPLGRTPVSGESIVLFASTTLASDILGDVFIAVSSTTLNGANHKVTGDVSGNGAYGGYDAYNFNLEYITITGTTTANGGDGTPEVSGGKGGILNVSTSSTGVLAVNGGDPLQNGGDAGTLTVFNSFAVEENTHILAVGGDSVGCGYGGSGGNVSLIDSSGYVIVEDNLAPGKDATKIIAEGGNCSNPPVGSSGSRGRIVANVGTYHAPASSKTTNTPSVKTASRPVQAFGLPNIFTFLPPINKLSPVKLPPLPTFGDFTNGKTFSLGPGIVNFVFAPLSKELTDKYASSPNLLSAMGLKNMRDLLKLKSSSFEIKDINTPGLFTVYAPGLPTRLANGEFKKDTLIPVTSYAVFDAKDSVSQMVKVDPKTNLTISLIPTLTWPAGEGTFNGKSITFANNRIKITAPAKPGTYILTAKATPLSLKIQVVDNKVQAVPSPTNTNQGIFNRIINFFKGLFR